MKPRGYRNNNPGNIRKSVVKWKGEVQGTDPHFCTFSTMSWGFRALMKLLQNYERKYGLRTIRQIISRWAPSNENNTAAYIASVARHTGFGRDETLNLRDSRTLILLADAIAKVENGTDASPIDIVGGFELLNQ